MLGAYDTCKKEKGSGAFMRMKNVMSTHVEVYKDFMFDKASKDLLSSLQQLKVCIRRFS